MKIKFLGTAATEAVPAPFCDCDICRRARELGGREYRSRSQALVDGRLLIDFNADTFMHMFAYGLDLINIRNCLITHIHTDHFYPAEFKNARPSYSELPEGTPPFAVYGSADIVPLIEQYRETVGDRVEARVLEPFVSYGIDGLTVTPLKARHGTPNPYIYLISDGAKTLLYANDTGYFLDDTWEYLEKEKPHVDLVSLDCTEGAMNDLPYDEHMCLGINIRVKNRLIESGIADGKTVFVSNHFSHSGEKVNYADYSVIAAKEGILTSYDGMEIEF